MKELISIIMQLAVLFGMIGSLGITILTNDPMPFVIGYPCGVLLMIVERVWDKRGVV